VEATELSIQIAVAFGLSFDISAIYKALVHLLAVARRQHPVFTLPISGHLGLDNGVRHLWVMFEGNFRIIV
jgi:hypothetical protein